MSPSAFAFLDWLWLFASMASGVCFWLLNRIYPLRVVVESDSSSTREPNSPEDRASEWTIREEAVAAVKAAEAKYRGIFENAVWGIFQTTPEGQYLSANPALARMYGYDSPGQMMAELNDISKQLYVDPHRRIEFAEQMRKNQVISGFESLIRRRDGSTIWISENARAIHDDAGQLLYYEGTVEDITRRKETDAWRQETEAAQAANAAKSAFLANMSHEIRTPLNGVIGMLDLLGGTVLDDRQQRYLRVGRSSAQSLLTLINDILDFSKIEAGKLELVPLDFELTTMVEDVMEIFASRAQEKGLELACSIAPGIPALMRGDADRIRQVLINLMGNAVKFTECGEVVLRVSAELDGDRPALVKFSVADTGIGIPRERVDRLFRAFSQVDASTTRKFGGTGLGLAISKQLVELMGGGIEVLSEPGRGSIFSFTVRLEPAAADQAIPSPPTDRLQGARVLVVDDNATNREIISEQLNRWGCQVSLCADPLQAIGLLRGARAAAASFQLVLLDQLMPELNGLELAAKIQEDDQLAPTPIVVLTSLGSLLTPEQIRERKLSGYITKPVRQSQLLDTLMSSLSGQGANARGEFASTCPHRAQEPVPATEAPSRSARLLVAEDNDVNQLVVREMLERAGYGVAVVGNGKEAVEAVLAEPFDLILMDCQMPEMDGFEATRLIRQLEADGDLGLQRRTLPIIALTANAFESDRQKCLEAGMNGHASKPIQSRSLLAAIEEHLAKSRSLTNPQELPATPPPEVANSATPPARDEKKGDDLASLPPYATAELVARCVGDVGLAGRVLRKFLAQLPRQLDELRLRMEKRDIAGTARVAHAIKGAAANLSARRLARVAGDLEQAARDGEGGSLSLLAEQVESEVDFCLRAGVGLAGTLAVETV